MAGLGSPGHGNRVGDSFRKIKGPGAQRVKCLSYNMRIRVCIPSTHLKVMWAWKPACEHSAWEVKRRIPTVSELVS